MSSIEEEYLHALDRLISGQTINVSPSATLSQNNVAREAGRDPSALRKSRYPKVVEAIRTAKQRVAVPRSMNEPDPSATYVKRLKAEISLLRRERDQLASKLLVVETELLERALEAEGGESLA